MKPSACANRHAFLKPLASLVALALCPLAYAAITVPGADGSDGALNITTDTVIDLSQAVTGTWDTNNAANAGKGVYDPAKWAVVFKYTDVTVAAGATVTFKNHASRAPVVWLVSGNVTINGTVSLNGQDHQVPPILAEPGPGGFRGGCGWYTGGVSEGAGFGVGGGQARFSEGNGAGGSYGTVGGYGPSVYGNPALLPLLGGAGGAGSSSRWDSSKWAGGGGGGGAMLIACSNSLALSGEIRANGGSGFSGGQFYSGSGSGGGVRLVADALSGAGKMNALGGPGGFSGGLGRIRIERSNNTANTIAVVPAPSTVDLAAGATALLWPPAGAPEVRVVSIGAAEAPADPRAAFGTYSPDVALPLTTTTEVIVETVNVEQASQVKVRITPHDSATFTEVAATYSSTVSTDPLTLRWTATVPTTMGNSAVQARVIRP